MEVGGPITFDQQMVDGFGYAILSLDANGNATSVFSGLGGAGSDNLVPRGLGADQAGNVSVILDFSGQTLFFGNPDLVADGRDVLVAGGVNRHFQLPGDQFPQAGTVLPNGDVIVAGQIGFQESADFGGGPLQYSSGRLFLFALDGGGNHQWSKNFGPNATGLNAQQIVPTDSGFVMFGEYAGDLDFGGDPLSGTGVFAVGFDASGAHSWTRDFPSAQVFDAAGMASHVVVVGRFSAPLDFGGGDVIPTGSDGFIASYDPAGNLRWFPQFEEDFAGQTHISVDSEGRVFLAALAGPGADLGGGPLTGSGQLVAAAFGPDGGHVWSKLFAGADEYFPKAVATRGGRDFLVGDLAGQVNLGGSTLVGTIEMFAGVFDP